MQKKLPLLRKALKYILILKHSLKLSQLKYMAKLKCLLKKRQTRALCSASSTKRFPRPLSEPQLCVPVISPAPVEHLRVEAAQMK